MKVFCHWDCFYNNNGECSQPKGLELELSLKGYFTCNKLSEICNELINRKETK